jgi:hypothetical protein
MSGRIGELSRGNIYSRYKPLAHKPVMKLVHPMQLPSDVQTSRLGRTASPKAQFRKSIPTLVGFLWYEIGVETTLLLIWHLVPKECGVKLSYLAATTIPSM